MSLQLRYASALSAAMMLVTILVSAEGSGANAQPYEAALQPAPVPAPIPESPAEPLAAAAPASAAESEAAAAVAPPLDARSLRELVAATPLPAELPDELECLAGAIYFEAKSETLEGQLAVGRVIVARSKSGRFPASYCGVVYQRSQFSFVRGRTMPAIPKASVHWKNAVRIAQIADSGSWKSPVEGALFFHATHVSPGWRLRKVARIDGHVFYR